MADESLTVEEFLEHQGVKGMKWGVRNDAGHVGERSTNKKIEKLDGKFEKAAGSSRLTLAVYNKAAVSFNDVDLPRINNKPEYTKAANDGSLLRDTPVKRQYDKELHDSLIKRINDATSDLGSNASGTRKFSVATNEDGSNWEIVTQAVSHADNGLETHSFKIKRDSKGLIVSITANDAMSHSELDNVDDFLAHYGVPGMKWGKHAAGNAVATLRNREHASKESFANKGDAILSKSGGSTGKASAKIAGKAVAGLVLANMATNTVAKLGKNNPKVVLGAAIAQQVLRTAVVVKTGMDTKAVIDSRSRTKNS